jgi:hypothetical protein
MSDEKQYISVSALKDRFKLRTKWLEKDVHDQYSLGLFHGAEYDTKLIDEITIVGAVEVVHGRWIAAGFMAVKCSECEDVFYELGCTNYCPNCGAKMDLEE